MSNTKQFYASKTNICEDCSIPKTPAHISDKLVQIREDLINQFPDTRPSWDATNDAIGSDIDRAGKLTDCTYDCLELKFLGKCTIGSTIDLDEI